MAKYKILVVDDQKDNLITIVGLIEEAKEPWEVYQANSGELAILIAKKQQPDLIIMDWEMPVMSGIEATKILRKDEETKDIPVIICTGIMTSSKHLEIAFEAGAVDFIRKPIDLIELHSRMQSMLLLSDSYKNIKKLNVTKNKLFSIIAHDLKSPIYTMKLLLDMVLHKQLPEEKKGEILKGVNLTAGSTFSLLENLLSWANSKLNKIAFYPVVFPFKGLINEIYGLLRLNAENKQIELNLDFNSEIEIYGDRNMISTVIRNLLSNAIKFNYENTKISCSAIDKGDFIELVVQDNGVGISTENIDKIQSNNNFYSTFGTKKETGSGIGIEICKEFIEKHNSKLKIESKLGEGSMFSFVLKKNK